MVSKIPIDQDKIGAPPVEVVEPVAAAVETQIGKAVIDGGPRKFDLAGIPGRDGTGSYSVLLGGVMLPDGSFAEPGDTFDPVAENVAPAMMQVWLANGMVSMRDKVTKEFTDTIITKG